MKAAPLLLIVLLMPQVTFAAWWNPLSWKVIRIFKESPKQEIPETKIDQSEDDSQPVIETKTASPKKETSTEVIKTKPVPAPAEALPTPGVDTVAPQTASSNTSETDKALADLLVKYSDLRREVGDIYNSSTNDQYKSFLRKTFNALSEAMEELNDLKKSPTKSASLLGSYTAKFEQIKSEYVRYKTATINRLKKEEELALQREVVEYIKSNKNNLYQESVHIHAALQLDKYDKAYGTKYAPIFKNTKTRVETIEFANSFLLDLGESF